MKTLLVFLTGLAVFGDTPEASKDNEKSCNNTCDGGKDNKKARPPNETGDEGQDNNNDKPPEVSTEDPEGGGEGGGKTKSTIWIIVDLNYSYIFCSLRAMS